MLRILLTLFAMTFRFVSNVDGTDFVEAVRDLDPAETLFIISSKTFTTLETMTYLQGDFTDPRAYSRLREHLAQLDSTAGTAGNYLFYLAVSDRFFGTVVDGLAMAGLVAEEDDRWRRVVIEKPFGHARGSRHH